MESLAEREEAMTRIARSGDPIRAREEAFQLWNSAREAHAAVALRDGSGGPEPFALSLPFQRCRFSLKSSLTWHSRRQVRPWRFAP